nr:tyrosine-type recombinase/integrase [Paraburkholderia sp. Ac-20347]
MHARSARKGWLVAARRRIAERRNWPDNLYKNSAGYYWYKNPYTKATYGLGRDFKVASAQAKAANAELLRRAGEAGLINRIDSTTFTLSAWCDKYLEKYEKSGKAPNSVRAVQSMMRAIKDAPFAEHPINKVMTREVNDYIELITKTRGPAITAKIRSRLEDVFRSAEAAGHVELGKNPATPVVSPTVEVARDRLTLEDFVAIVEKSREDPGLCWATNALELALLTGLRVSDIANLRFDQVREGFLWVEPIKSQGSVKLKIPVSVGLAQIGLTIEDVMKRCRDNVVSKYAVHSVRVRGLSKPGHKIDLDTISGTFASLREAAKVKWRDGMTPPTFHEIRSLAIRMYSDEVSPEFAQALVGHKSASMTALYRDHRGREWTEVKVVAGK